MPFPWGLYCTPPFASPSPASPLRAQRAQLQPSRDLSALALPRGGARPLTCPGPTSLRPGVGPAGEEDGTRVPACSPSPTAGGGSEGCGRQGGERRRAGGRKEVGLGPRRGRKFSQGSREPREPGRESGVGVGLRGPGRRTGPDRTGAADRDENGRAAPRRLGGQGSRLHPSDLSVPICRMGLWRRVREIAP